MKFTDQPNYNYLRQLLINELNLRGLEDDKQFDWTKKKNSKLNNNKISNNKVAKITTTPLTTSKTSEIIAHVKKITMPIILNIIKSIIQTH